MFANVPKIGRQAYMSKHKNNYVWEACSLCDLWVVMDPNLVQANSEDSEQPEWMSRLICDFAESTGLFVGFAML